MKLIGLTGGIGSGKSVVAQRLEFLGIPVLDADRIGHEVLLPGGAAEGAVRDLFGEAILSEGSIDRALLAARVFASPALLAQLNRATHPAIEREIARQSQALLQAGHPVVVVEAALWGEHGKREAWLDGLILVRAPEALRVERLKRARGMADEAARARVRAQADPEQKVALADWVIDNDGPLDALHARVDALAKELHAQSGGSEHRPL